MPSDVTASVNDAGPSGPWTSWDVVATIRADPAYVARFIASYRALGARQIHIFYDDPDLAPHFDGDDLILVRCDGDYWTGHRPTGIEERQTRNAAVAVRASRADWILHCDVDEILAADAPIGQILAGLPETVGCLRVPPVEAVFAQRPQTIDDIYATPWFRSHDARPRVLDRFWSAHLGALADLTENGFLGHREGKCLLRRPVAQSLAHMPLHKPPRRDQDRIGTMWSDRLVLRHYDALLPDAWTAKHLDRAMGRVQARKMGDRRFRLAQLLAHCDTTEGPDGLLALYDRFFVMPERRLQRGLALGAVRRIPPGSAGLPGSAA